MKKDSQSLAPSNRPHVPLNDCMHRLPLIAIGFGGGFGLDLVKLSKDGVAETAKAR
jgi:hypothetical protein